MHALIWRCLQTTVLTGGFVAVGAGIAAAAENDVTIDVAGLTATVPVADGTVLETPLVTGTGEPLTVTGDDGGSAGGITLPVDTNDEGNTSVEPGQLPPTDDGIGAVSVPVTVTEADGAQPDPQDGLTATVPVNTSDGNEDAGTTVVAPVVTGDLGNVLDGDPTTGNDVDVDLADLVVVSDRPEGGRDVLVDVADLVTIGGNDGGTSPDTLLAVPVSADGGEDTTVSLPVRSGDDTSGSALLGGGTTAPSAPAGGTSLATARAWADAPSRHSGDVLDAATDAGTLAYTGADPLLPAVAGLLVLTAGLLLTYIARHRRSAQR